MFGKSLRAVLAEYREKHDPHTAIDQTAMSEAIGYWSAQYVGTAPGHMTEQQKRAKRAVTTLTRCRRLLEVIEKYERV